MARSARKQELLGKPQINQHYYEVLMTTYAGTWNRHWPHERSYLAELWAEAKEKIIGSAKATGTAVAARKEELFQFTLERMREDHVFDPANGA